MPTIPVIFGVALVGWFVAIVGLYRISFDPLDRNGGWRGWGEVIGLTANERARRQSEVWTKFFSARHDFNRRMIWAGFLLFFGCAALVLLVAGGIIPPRLG